MKEKFLHKKTMNRERGITLITLVVTIIVLIILASISIGALTGEDGIIRKTNEGKEDTRGGEVKDIVERTAIENEMATYSGDTPISKEDLIKKLEEEEKLTTNEVNALKTGDTVKIGQITIDFSILDGSSSGGGTIAGTKYDTETTIEIEGTPVTIPGKFTVSGLEKESKRWISNIFSARWKNSGLE